MALDPITTTNQESRMKTITIYTTPACSQCNMTKRWLETRNIPYSVVDATADENVADSIRSLAASDGNTGKVQMPYVQYSTGDPETDFHWFGFIPAHREKYATTITQEAA